MAEEIFSLCIILETSVGNIICKICQYQPKSLKKTPRITHNLKTRILKLMIIGLKQDKNELVMF